jgi:hypothetical protein
LRSVQGPAYQPLNEFLREVSKLGASWRRQLARSHQFSYAATVRHLSNGLRKLARMNTEVGVAESTEYRSISASGAARCAVWGAHVRYTRLLRCRRRSNMCCRPQFAKAYRGVRGELPEAFWLRDAFGMVTATDFGFMSTSLDRVVSEGFLGSGGVCVLWEIECGAETDDGFHSAADVSLLSQYPGEKEMLFPPLTMLQVQVQGGGEGRGAYEAHMTANGAKYICIRVRPTFV